KLAAAETFLRRQSNAGWLDTSPLYGQKVYYRPSRRLVDFLRKSKLVRLSRAATRPLKPFTKLQRYAALLYCTPATGQLRTLYRPSLDAESFPDIAEHLEAGRADPLRQKLFYRDGEVVGLFAVDRGQHLFIERKVKPKVLALAE